MSRSRRQILDALRRPVSLVEGPTGCGKSTQVAQFLLEDAARTGRRISIAFTQPRRISAVGVAERVAAERGEIVGRGAVGYAVRGETRQSVRGNALLVCTVGVLLRILEEDSTLGRFDVILVDEVHERSVENDFLLLALRRVLLQQDKARRRRASARKTTAESTSSRRPTPMLPKLRICLMSATLDSDYFERYFAQPLRVTVPRVRVRGRTYAVTTRYLEHALEETDHIVLPSAPWCLHSAAARRRAAQSVNPDRIALLPQAKVAERFPGAPPSVLTALRMLDITAINVDLILQLVRRFVESEMPADHLPKDLPEARVAAGGVLIFLPGSGEIDEVRL